MSQTARTPRSLRPWQLATSALVLALAASTAVALTPSPASAIDYPNAERIDVGDAVSAGVAVSQRLYAADAAGSVVLTRTDKFPDGLASSALAGEKDGPVLFTPSAALDAATRAELDRVLPDGGPVYLMGGEEALAPAIEDELDDAGYRTIRIGGPDRIATAALTARFFVGAGPDSSALLVRGYGEPDDVRGWPDAISCGGYAAATQTPILLTNPFADTIHQATIDTLEQLGVTDVKICGGPAAVPTEHASQLVGMGISVSRFAGDTRVTTAVDVARRLWNKGTSTDGDHFILINGWDTNFAYGIAAAPLSAAIDAPLLVVFDTEPDTWPVDCSDLPDTHAATACYLNGDGEGRIGSLTALGATSLISDAVFEATARAGGLREDTQPPTVPQSVAAADTAEDDGSQLDVTWDASTDDSGGQITYTVYVRESAEDAMTTSNSTAAGSVTDATALTVDGLTEDTEYQVAVTATDPFGRTSALSDPATATPTDEVPAAPAVPPSVQQTAPATVTVGWLAAPEDDAAGYVIQRATPGNDDPLADGDQSCDESDVPLVGTDYTDVATVDDPGAGTYDDGSVTADQEYCYRYLVLDTTGNRSDPSPHARFLP